jgi:hypothetical protein
MQLRRPLMQLRWSLVQLRRSLVRLRRSLMQLRQSLMRLRQSLMQLRRSLVQLRRSLVQLRQRQTQSRLQTNRVTFASEWDDDPPTKPNAPPVFPFCQKQFPCQFSANSSIFEAVVPGTDREVAAGAPFGM